MGFFDLFKRKKTEESKREQVESVASEQSATATATDTATQEASAEDVEVVNVEAERKELEAGLEKTKESPQNGRSSFRCWGSSEGQHRK